MARASSTFALAVLLGVGTYLGIKADSSTGEMLSVTILVVSIVAAAAIGRGYVLASLAGPFLALVVLESQDYIGNDGVQPLGFIMLFTNLSGPLWPCSLALARTESLTPGARESATRTGASPQ